MANEKEPKKENKLLKLFKGAKRTFFPNKESVEEFKAKEKAKADILIEAAQKLMRETRGTIDHNVAKYDGDDKEVYLYDFLSEVRSGNAGFMLSATVAGGTFSAGGSGASFDGDDGFDGDSNLISVAPSNPNGTTTVAIDAKNMEKLPPKRIYKPKEVFGELERVPTKVELENLDDKILVLNMKKDFIRNNQYAKKEVIDMVTRLENRKQYNEHKEFFERFDNTTTEKINDLVNKYELVLKSSDLFIPSFPDEAIKIMDEYIKTVKKMCGKKPIFYVIAESEKFKKENDRNDPILLVQSPFGIYWQILGAWDEELVLLSEL